MIGSSRRDDAIIFPARLFVTRLGSSHLTLARRLWCQGVGDEGCGDDGRGLQAVRHRDVQIGKRVLKPPQTIKKLSLDRYPHAGRYMVLHYAALVERGYFRSGGHLERSKSDLQAPLRSPSAPFVNLSTACT
jgi:hypothetical protein